MRRLLKVLTKQQLFSVSIYRFEKVEIIIKMNNEKLGEMSKDIYYSDKYYDDEYEYRHVVLPKDLVKLVPKTHLMSEQEWRGIGVQQSKGWVHYMTHAPEPHILLFKRPISTPSRKQE